MPTGTITRFFKQQGYGYITPDDNDGDYVVVIDEVACRRVLDVEEGVRVHFDEGDADKGLRATNVVVLDPVEQSLMQN